MKSSDTERVYKPSITGAENALVGVLNPYSKPGVILIATPLTLPLFIPKCAYRAASWPGNYEFI